MSMILVWERNHITKIGYRISKLQKRKLDLIEDNRTMENDINRLLSGERITTVLNSLDLGLAYNVALAQNEGVNAGTNNNAKNDTIKEAKKPGANAKNHRAGNALLSKNTAVKSDANAGVKKAELNLAKAKVVHAKPSDEKAVDASLNVKGAAAVDNLMLSRIDVIDLGSIVKEF